MSATRGSPARRPVLLAGGPAVTAATSPHWGQASAQPSKEYKQPQKHATSAITDTSFRISLRAGFQADAVHRTVASAGPGLPDAGGWLARLIPVSLDSFCR